MKKKQAKSVLENTGERMIPEFHKGSLVYAEHITRYLSATPLIKDKKVLDIASGSGYGSNIMAAHAKKVIGVDLDEDAVAYAKKNYSASNLEFKQGSGTEIPLEDNSVDVVVTFETIEHIEDYPKFMSEISRVLKTDGVAIISTPNDVEFPEGAHFHVHEFEYEELLELVSKDFKYIEPYFQATWRSVAVGDKKFFESEWEDDVRTLNLAPLEDNKYLYFYLICSNKKIAQKLEPIMATGQHHSDREVISSWANMTNEVDRRQKHIEELYQVIEKTNEQNEMKDTINKSLQEELTLIKSSKGYAAAQKLSRLKRRATGR